MRLLKNAHCGPPRLFAALPDPHWEPDGAIVDAEGGVWNAQWRASRVVRYRPDGHVDRVVLLPVRNPTCVALGGAGMRQLMITSSRLDHTDGQLAASPHAGGVFALETGIAGLPERPFRWA